MGLAELRSVYRCPGNAVRVYFEVMIAVCFAAGTAQNAGSGQGLAGNHSTWAVVAASLIFGLPVPALLAMAVMTRLNRRLYLYSGGLVITGITGRIWRAAVWADAKVYWSARNSLVDGYLVTFAQGGQLRFGRPGLRKPGVLTNGAGPQLRIISCAAKLPDALRQLEADEPMGFGPLSIDGQGITHGETTLPWRDVNLATILFSTRLLVEASDRRKIIVRCSAIADLNVLEILIAQATGTRFLPQVSDSLDLPAAEWRAAQASVYGWTIRPRARPHR